MLTKKMSVTYSCKEPLFTKVEVAAVGCLPNHRCDNRAQNGDL